MKSIILDQYEVREVLEGRSLIVRLVRTKVPIHKDWKPHTILDTTGRSKDIGKVCFQSDDVVMEEGKTRTEYFKLPYKVGQKIWVKETFKEYNDWDFVYKFDGEDYSYPFMPWISPGIMPQKASRITLEIVEVKVKRLDDMNSGELHLILKFALKEYPSLSLLYLRELFLSLWDEKYNKKGYGCETNPYVWLYEVNQIEVEK